MQELEIEGGKFRRIEGRNFVRLSQRKSVLAESAKSGTK